MKAKPKTKREKREPKTKDFRSSVRIWRRLAKVLLLLHPTASTQKPQHYTASDNNNRTKYQFEFHILLHQISHQSNIRIQRVSECLWIACAVVSYFSVFFIYYYYLSEAKANTRRKRKEKHKISENQRKSERERAGEKSLREKWIRKWNKKQKKAKIPICLAEPRATYVVRVLCSCSDITIACLWFSLFFVFFSSEKYFVLAIVFPIFFFLYFLYSTVKIA